MSSIEDSPSATIPVPSPKEWPPEVTMCLETDRLELRPLTLGDLDEIASMLSDAEGLIHWGPPLSREESRSWIERNLRRYKEDGFGRCAVILRSTGELVGDCGLIRTHVEGEAEVELGWIVRSTHRGKRIARRPPPRGWITRSARWSWTGSCRW